ATSHAAKEKATLIAGNVRGVEAVEDEALRVAAQQAGAAAGAAAAPAQSTGYRARYYTIKSGDTLSGIANEYYGDANRWQELFEASREVIKGPDKIYPGQRIRVPVDGRASARACVRPVRLGAGRGAHGFNRPGSYRRSVRRRVNVRVVALPSSAITARTT